MSSYYLVRLGATGRIGRCLSDTGHHYPRSCRVVVRTHRGLELGEVVSSLELLPSAGCSVPAGPNHVGPNLFQEPTAKELPLQTGHLEGQVLRQMSTEDYLTENRFEIWSNEAYEACANFLSARQLPVLLADVECTFDGQGMIFHFLGEISLELTNCIQKIARSREAEAYLDSGYSRVASSENGCGGCGSFARSEGSRCGGCGTNARVDLAAVAEGNGEAGESRANGEGQGGESCGGCSGCTYLRTIKRGL